MRKKFFGASVLAIVLLALSGSGIPRTYSAASTLATDPCQKTCELELSYCASGGIDPFGRCWGQYMKCHNQCKGR
ncbi:MAG: hypothetical protein QOD75_3361 [Blastocatellia bacterium]|jgi:hypothetical protein|nr:hypothetical protein [Blastocatellia bacterium]